MSRLATFRQSDLGRPIRIFEDMGKTVTGRDWVRDSFWDAILKRAGENVRALKLHVRKSDG